MRRANRAGGIDEKFARLHAKASLQREMQLMKRRASQSITLVLLSTALLNGCDRPVETRDVYLTRQDCVHDWGDERKCESGPGQGGAHGYYYGPAYTGTRNAPTARSESRAVTSHSVVRGGFGASASAHAGTGG